MTYPSLMYCSWKFNFWQIFWSLKYRLCYQWSLIFSSLVTWSVGGPRGVGHCNMMYLTFIEVYVKVWHVPSLPSPMQVLCFKTVGWGNLKAWLKYWHMWKKLLNFNMWLPENPSPLIFCHIFSFIIVVIIIFCIYISY